MYLIVWIVSPTPFVNKLNSSRDFINFMISFISSFEIFNVPKTFFWIVVCVSDTAAVNPNGIKSLFARGPKSLPKSPLGCLNFW